MVPIVEPDVMLDGDHDIDMCQKISEKVLVATFAALHKACFELFKNNSGNILLELVCINLWNSAKHNVLLEGILLKTNMVTPGAKCPNKVDAKTIAKYTVECLRRTVPSGKVLNRSDLKL